MIVSNASPIIFFCKLKKVELLIKLFKKIYISEKVFDEISKRKDEFSYLKKHISHFKVEKVKGKILIPQLHEGESETINLALNKKSRLVLLDDKKARIIAKNMGLNIKGTLGVLLSMLDKKYISYNEFKELLDKLISNNFRISISVYNEVLKYAEKI